MANNFGRLTLTNPQPLRPISHFLPAREDVVTDTYAMAPKQALEVIEATGAEDAARLLADHAAAGLVRSYAQILQSIDAKGQRSVVRGGRVPPEVWERMIGAGVYRDAWTGGTVRLDGSDLIGGVPAVHVTGFAFHPADVERLANQQRPPHRQAKARRVKVERTAAVKEEADQVPAATPTRPHKAPDLSVLHSGALLLTVKQTEAALARGRTWVYDRIKEGKLVQPEGDTRITAESVRRLAGFAE